MLKRLFLDYESRYSSKDGYTLSKMSYSEYLYNEKFRVFGVGYAWDDGDPHWITGDPHVMSAWMDTIDWANTVVVAHNAKFDGSILEWHYGRKPAVYICTQGLSRAVLGTGISGHSLAKIAEFYGLEAKGIMQTDGLESLTAAQEADLAAYCKHDVWLCREIYQRLAKGFPGNQYWDLDWTIKTFLRPQLVLDQKVLETTHAEEKKRRETIFTDIGIEKAVFSSNKKFPALLESKGYEVPSKLSPRTAKPIPALALGDEGFQELISSGNPELEALCEARIAAKSTLLETRSEKLLAIARLGSFPFDVNFSGALQTHRYSGGNGAGGNPQNFKKGSGLRRAVSVPFRQKLLVADFSAVEARIVAYLAGEPKLTELFAVHGDPYLDFAKVLNAERAFGKECILGLGYGMGWEKFQKRVKLKLGRILTEAEAKKTVKGYRTYYPRIPLLWERLENLIHVIACGGSAIVPGAPFIRVDDHAIVLPSGLKLRYPLLKRDETGAWEYKAYSKGHQESRHLYGAKLLENVSQALAGEFTKHAIREAADMGVTCVGQIHDELLVVTDKPAEDAESLLLAMRRAAKSFWPEIVLDAEVGTGLNWLDAKK